MCQNEIEAVATDERAECCECSARIANGDEVTSHDCDIYCLACYYARFASCRDCGAEIERAGARYDERREVDLCEHCYDDMYATCGGCGCEIARDEIHSHHPGDCYCADCFRDLYVSCDECGRIVDRDDAIENCGRNYCDDCAPQRAENIDIPHISDAGILTRRAFAVELEVVDSQRAESALVKDGWESVYDASLATGGREYCSGPIGGQVGIDRIKRAGDHLSRANARVDQSCGFHLHIDASSEPGEVVARFARLAKRLEKWAFLTVPRSRRDNHYCAALRDEAIAASSAADAELVAYGPGGGKHSEKSNKYDAARYRWINVHSWFFRGTIEIRLHSGTTSAKKILEWCRFWLHAIEFAKRSTIAEIDACPADDTAGFWLIEKMGLPVAAAGYFAERIKKLADSRARDSI